MSTKRSTLVTAAFTIVGLAGCGASVQANAPRPTAQYPFACAALVLANQGNWAQAQHRWLSAEQSASDGSAVAAFAVLNVDSGVLAADQLTGHSQTADLATYRSDLSGDSAFVAGC